MTALVIILAQWCDLSTFLAAVSVHGIGGESNPLMRLAYVRAGLWGVAGMKLVATALILLCIAGLRPAWRPWAVGAVVGLALLGSAVNVLAVVLR